MLSSKTLQKTFLVGVAIAVWAGCLTSLHAQLGGLQIGIGRFGGPYGGGGFGGSLYVPFGVGPSIPPSSRAYMGPQFYPGYSGYSGSRGYYGSYYSAPSLGVYSYPPFDYPSPTYRSYGYGPYSGNLGSSYQYSLDQQQLQLHAEQLRLSAPQTYPSAGQYRGSRSGYATQPPIVSPSTPDLRPGMVLPDGATVISVGPLSGTPKPATPPPPAPQPNKSTKSNRAEF